MDVLRAQLGHVFFELADGHFHQALHGAFAREDAVRIDVERGPLERARLVLVRLVQLCEVMRPVGQHHLHAAFFFAEQQPSRFRQVHFRLVRQAVIGYEHAAPPDPGRHLANINDEIRKIRIEHPRFDLGFAPRHQQLERNFAEGLICGGQRDDHDVGCRGRCDEGEEQNRAEQLHHAHAAGFQRHDLAIAREAPEREQDAEEQRHRNGNAQRLRHERGEHAHDDVPRRTLGDERFAVFEDGRNLERKGEQQQRKPEGRHQLAQQIPIENPQHLR